MTGPMGLLGCHLQLVHWQADLRVRATSGGRERTCSSAGLFSLACLPLESMCLRSSSKIGSCAGMRRPHHAKHDARLQSHPQPHKQACLSITHLRQLAGA